MRTLLLLACLVDAAGSSPAPLTHTASGRIADRHGHEVPGATVSLESSDDRSVRRIAVSDGAGRFRLDGVPAGTYAVRIEHPDYRVSEALCVVRAEGVDVTVILRPR